MFQIRYFNRRSQKVTSVKSRLLPLPRFVAALERMLEALPRPMIDVHLKPVNDIAALDTGKGNYKSTGYNPWFELALDPSPEGGGWYYLEASLVRNNGNRQANIYAELDGNPSLAVPIPSNLRGSVREVFYLPPKVRALRWAPTAAPGFFSQSPLLIHKISSLESFFRRCFRVLFDLWRFRTHTSASRGGLSFWSALWNLQDAYRRTVAIRVKRTMGNDYRAFVENSETLSKKSVRAIYKQIEELTHRPLFSIILPLHDPVPDLLVETLDSVAAQFYSNWELCLVGNPSIDVAVLELIRQRQMKDTRIKLILDHAANSDASRFNLALGSVTGEYVTVVKQHDLVQPVALFYVAMACDRHPDSQLIYSDEDHVDKTGQRIDPIFKPDWNPDLILSQNYISSLGLYRRTLVAELEGYRDGYDGAEEYDLLLRSLAKVAGSQITHIPKVLYSRRTFSRNAQGCNDASQRAHEAGQRALQEHLAPTGATVESGPAPCLYRIRHPLPEQLPLVTLIIPTRDQVDILRKCVESVLQKTDYKNWEMLIVDNQSEEAGTLAYFEEIQTDPRITVLNYDKPFNYSALNNFAVQFAKGEILGLLNNDVEVIAPGWLCEMVSHATRPEIGAVGAKLLYENGMVQHAGVILGIGGVAGHAHKYIKGDDPGYCCRASLTQNLSAVTGACLIVRKVIYQEVNGLNENDLVVAFNDIDFCLKVREAGYRNLYTPFALLYHHESLSRGPDDTIAKQAIFKNEFEYMKTTWRNQLASDPAYNPNLSMESEIFLY